VSYINRVYINIEVESLTDRLTGLFVGDVGYILKHDVTVIVYSVTRYDRLCIHVYYVT